MLSEAVEITRENDGWTVKTTGATYRCRAIVNAAGAWADQVAVMAGVQPARLSILKRTAFASPASAATVDAPLVLATDGSCYLKPDVPGLVLCSPSDETPTAASSPIAEKGRGLRP